MTEETLQKLFGIVGKLKQIHIGEYKNKANNKRKRRTVYFAIVVYKNVEDCKMVLNEPKFLQSKVNKVMKKSAKFSKNPFARDEDDSDLDSEEEAAKNDPSKKEHTAQMQDGGFTMVIPLAQGSSKGRGTDGVNTVQGISKEEAQEYYDKQQLRYNPETGVDKEGGVTYTSNRSRQAALMKTDFYKF